MKESPKRTNVGGRVDVAGGMFENEENEAKEAKDEFREWKRDQISRTGAKRPGSVSTTVLRLADKRL